MASDKFFIKGRSPVDMGDILSEIVVPDLGGALSFKEKKIEINDIFADKQRKAWDKSVEARCDFQKRVRLNRRAGLTFITRWQKSLYGRTLTEIKSDEAMVDFFATEMVDTITEIMGSYLESGGWCIITTPKRRHLTKNFATRISEKIAMLMRIPFYEDVCSCRSKQRVNAVFDVNVVPKEQNIICYDDFVTTGSTLRAMKTALEPYKKNVIFFAGINNKI